MTNHALTEREKQILKLIAQGLTNKSISRQLVIAEATVENHIHSIFEKLNISNRSQATAYAFQNGLVLSENDKNDK
jgi:DNA-binding NarL/FixJ family response regulator